MLRKAKVQSTERFIRFAEDVASLMRESFLSQTPQLREIEAERIATEATKAAAEFNAQLLAASESALRVELRVYVGTYKIGYKIARLHQQCD